MWRTEGFRYALDNGAWSAFNSGQKWDAGRFREFYSIFGAEADWVVAPDIVAGGLESLRLTESWLPELCGLRLIAVQDGMSCEDVAPLITDNIGIFLGGSTEYKLSSMAAWGEFTKERGIWFHVGRVNSRKRILMCAQCHATSFDGTSASRFQKTMWRLESARQQQAFNF